ncbi:Protein of unknown function DUF3468 [Penicillium coprophilum]|uniref:Protein of unknown function DUF3468 n=1 Tax=Penicillium coprophilum TaxID=36646 RepID=UPI00239BA36E|nr:Protein of unknown function DUF3468 [Penicillium coprophilum]KAJ5150691.1 Protein of unknown function DUF3468 [Penicillium coprophilum]
MATQFAFITYDGEDKQTSTDRYQVRSHCMKGRNKREGSRRSKREARQAAKKVVRTNVDMSPVPILKGGLSSALNSAASRAENAAISTKIPQRVKQKLESPRESPWARLPQVPQGFLFGAAMDEFANAVGQTPESLTRQFMTFNRITEASYPLVEVVVDFNDVGLGSIWSSFDKSFLHTILFVNSAVNDWAQNLPLAKSSQFHLGKTLTLLNKKLATGTSHQDDMTIYTVMLLAVVSSTSGDYNASNAHMAGLQRLVEMRNNHGYLWVNPVTQFKLECLDLMWCLIAGGAPLFLKTPVSWDPVFTRPSPSVDDELSVALSKASMDRRLIVVFQELQRLTGLIEIHTDSNMRLNASEFQPVLSSIQTRLLHLKDLLVGMPDEWLCLGMLAFLATMFRAPGRQVAYEHLADRLRRACSSLVESTSMSTRSGLRPILRWLVIVCGATIFGTGERWIRELWDGITEPKWLWPETRTELKRVMWIGCIHNQKGQQIFAALNLRR